MAEPYNELVVPERRIPTPPTISPEARAALSMMSMTPRVAEPALEDIAAWRAYIAQADANLMAMVGVITAPYPADCVTHQMSAAPLYELTPHNIAPENDKRALFYIHGGAFILGGGAGAIAQAKLSASASRIKTFSVDYRMPPDHPFPAGLNDAIEAYQQILKRYKPENIAVYGPSAGGGLAGAFVLKARDMGLPMPGACVLPSPEIDLTESGDTFETNDTIDVMLKGRLSNSVRLYADGHDLRDPYLSPLFGDFSKGFPPTILTAGTRDVFLSNAVLMHRALLRAGVKAELHVFEAMPHGGFLGTAPEDREAIAQCVTFIDAHLGKS